MPYMSTRMYANMGVKSSLQTSTIQPQALNSSKCPLSVLNLKMSFVFQMCNSDGEDMHQSFDLCLPSCIGERKRSLIMYSSSFIFS